MTNIVSLDGEDIKVTPIEFRILTLLLENHGIVFSSQDIYEKVWDEDAYNCEKTVVSGIGYKIEKLTC